VFPDEASALATLPPNTARMQALPAVAHSLTHRELRLHPLLLDLPPTVLPDGADGRWVALEGIEALGLPAPVRQLLVQLPD
jgi:A/G-specific adenine glycosylase